MQNRKILFAIGAFVCAASVIALIIFYSLFTSSHIFSESANHLEEIYSQVNANFSSVVTRNWNVLNGWSNYIEEKAVSDEEELVDFIEARRADWEFTNFYFLNKDGVGKLVKADDGVTERELNISRDKLDDLKKGENVVVSGMRGDDEVPITLFAIPAKGGSGQNVYKGFEYNALGITFDSSDMTKTLSIEAFSGEGRCYIVDSVGEMLMASEAYDIDNDPFANFLEHLVEHKAVFVNGSYQSVEEGLKENKTSVALFSIHGMEYYLSYQPVKSDDGKQFNDWMMLGIVPSGVLNASMSSFRTITVVIMAGIFVLLAAAVMVVIVFIYKRHVQAKELELKSRDGLFDLLTMTTNEIFVLFSPDDFTAQYISPNLQRVLGIDPEGVRKDIHNIMEASVVKHSLFTTEELKKLPNDRTWSTDLQMRNQITGEEFWFKLTLYRTNASGADNFVMMFSDRTKERRMNENLQEALEIAKAANSAKSNFLSNMSHDIRTPMNAIMGFATLLQRDADKPDKVLEYVRKITYSSQHLLSLINDVLDMSKIESGKTSLNMEEFSLSKFLEELYSIMLPQAKGKEQTLEIHSKGILPETVLGDKLRLNQILMNLLSNAVKYTPNGGRIDVSVEALEQASGNNRTKLRFIVADNGIGMSEEFVKRIFEPFTRESTMVSKEIQGTGLGMAITKNIVDLMGGTINVDSKCGKGSTFSVEIELAIVEDGIPEADFWKKHRISRVLVVDDEKEVCEDICKLMEGSGVAVSYALDGISAVKTVEEAVDKREEYDIILLDWKMPGLSGEETAKRIHKIIGRKVPIFVLTSYDFEEIEEETREAGIDYFLPKPFFVSNFRHAVSRLKDKKKNVANEEQREENISLEGLKVLAADDNELNVEILVELLDIEGVKCDVANDGREVTEMFLKSEKGQYDLILMDIQMPEMNGYDAAKAIRASNHPDAKTIPILAMTANAFADDVKAAFDSGMNAHLSKPVDIGKLKQTIAELRKK